MCVRYVGVDARNVRDEERLEALRERYRDVPMPGDRFPGDLGEIVRAHGQVDVGRWGLQPPWASDPQFGMKNAYNARAETLAEKPTFRTPLRRRRCLVPAASFYERAEGRWLRVFPKQDEAFMIAGLFEDPEEGGETSFTMVTTEPNLAMKEVHDRMPVLLSNEDALRWLDPDAGPRELRTLLIPCPPEWIQVEDAGSVRSRKIDNDPRLFE